MFRRLDLLPIVQKDIIQRTNTGGLFSLLLIFSLSWFVTYEIMMFNKTEIVTVVQVEEPGKDSHLLNRLTVIFNVTFPNCACDVLSIETQDKLGALFSDYDHYVYGEATKGLMKENHTFFDLDALEDQERRKGHSLNRWRLINKNGTVKVVEFEREEEISKLANQPSKFALLKTEGCTVDGLLRIGKIPGSLKISTKNHVEALQLLYGRYPDMSHRIESFRFGPKDLSLNLHSYVSKEPAVLKQDYKSVSYEYYLNVVPTIDIMDKRVWRFTASNNYHANAHAPEVHFHYDFSPLAIVQKEKHESVSRFTAKLLAIVGAYISLTVFSVFVLNSSFSTLSKLMFNENRKPL